MPKNHLPKLSLVTAAVLAVTVQLSEADDASSQISTAVSIAPVESVAPVEQAEPSNFQDYIKESRKAEEEMKKSLEVKDTIFGIPVLGNDKSEPEVIKRSAETLKRILDLNNDGEADNPELVQYMANHNFRVVVAGSPHDLGNLDPDDFTDSTTAEISGKGLNTDSYLMENLGIVSDAYLALLKEKAKDSLEAKEELASLEKAIAQLKDNGLNMGDDDDQTSTSQADEEEGDDSADYIVMGELILSGQFPTIYDRLTGVIRLAVQHSNEAKGKDIQDKDIEYLIPNSLKKLRAYTPESFQNDNPLLCEWLSRHSLSAPVVDLEKVEIVLDKETISDLNDDSDDDEKDSSKESDTQTTTNV
ncbi:hypothetical protein [Parendozoicomonas sp. Alg238-R29]|uniref:hypothetical protein n=1 Tax=Parendozoicomonas sp. Alg238-R29 TaxID=2993446 RepID=UPI00248D8B26|nr:hypothetical protein [Parendozoicomonas sp. Alg238-R29]